MVLVAGEPFELEYRQKKPDSDLQQPDPWRDVLSGSGKTFTLRGLVGLHCLPLLLDVVTLNRPPRVHQIHSRRDSHDGDWYQCNWADDAPSVRLSLCSG